jgi:polar amino acid transport system permease protein
MTAAAYLTLFYGTVTTMALSLAAIAVGLPLGLLMALARWRRLPVANGLIKAYVSMMLT